MKHNNIKNKHQDYRVLLVYPNIQQCELMPYSMGLFTSLLKQEEFTVDLFDSTFYLNEFNSNYKNYQTALKPVDWEEQGVKFKTSSMVDNFVKKIEEYGPDLIAVSVVENTYSVGRDLIRAIPKRLNKHKILWGGVFATFAPEFIFRDNVGDYVCRGEGENALLEFCRKDCANKPLNNIPNIWARENNQLYKNNMGPRVNLDELPFADYSLFEEQAIYRPMQGKIWRTIGIESQRGCPYTCTFCNSPSQNQLSKNELGSIFYRKKSYARVFAEIEYLHKKHNIELIYWLVDTFLAMSDKEFDELVERYTEFKIPFWMNTRAETMSEHRAIGLEKMNMLRMNIGIEHGNYKYRKEILDRKLSDEVLLNAFEVCKNKNFTTTGNSIIGMPKEDRALIFDTIEFCRKLPKETEHSGAFIFAPYHGTPLRKLAIDLSYIDPNTLCDIMDEEASMLDQPQLRKKEVLGLAKTFGLYQVLPKSEWKWIKKAENDTNEAKKIYERLQKEYHAINAAARLDEGQVILKA